MLPTYMYDATPAQVGQAYKCFEGSQPFFKVVNSKGEFDSEGHLIEYTVKAKYDKEAQKWVFSCTCLSGQHNFANVKHQSKVCWHVRASLACSQEEKKALREMAAQIDAEKQQPTEDTRPVATSMVQVALGEPGQYRIPTWDDVKPVETSAKRTEVQNAEPVTVTPTERAIVATEVARDLRAKTAARAVQWNNSHQSTIPDSQKPLYEPKKPALHGDIAGKPVTDRQASRILSKPPKETTVKGGLYYKPFSIL